MYVVTTNDYVQTSKQMTLYYLFKKGGYFGQRPNRSKLLLQKMTMFGDPIHLQMPFENTPLGQP
jgi:hypothetical protein